MTTQPSPATAEMRELEPCPFCGISPEVMRGDEALKPMCRIICRAFEKCKVLPSTAWHRRADEATTVWNTRVNSHAALLREREALQQHLRATAAMLKETAFALHVESNHKPAFANCANVICSQACYTWNKLTEGDAALGDQQ